MTQFVHVGGKVLPVQEGADPETVQAALDEHEAHRFARKFAEGTATRKRSPHFGSPVPCKRTGGSRRHH